MIKLLHLNCGGNLAIDVKIQNIFGQVRASINRDVIVAKFAGLIGKGVTVQGTQFMCLRCSKEIAEEEIGINCKHTGNLKPIGEFIIMKSKKEGMRTKSNLVHKEYVNQFIKDYKREGYKIEKVEPKLKLDMEVKRG